MRTSRVFVAGATGVIGRRIVPLLVEEGHIVAGMTRTHAKAARLMDQGAIPVVADVFDMEHLSEVVGGFEPDVIIHELTDLPDDPSRIEAHMSLNSRIRTEGTDNLLAAALHSASPRFLAQSVAWPLDGEAGRAVAYHEKAVLDFGGTVLRYGQFYGPGTFHEDELPPPPRIHIDEAARLTVHALDADAGVIELIEPTDDDQPTRIAVLERTKDPS